jgi:hypothetical protein
MSDVTVAAEQDQIAESLLGEPTDQPTETTGTEQPETEVEQPVEQPQEEQAEEQTDDWLPTEQEKVFPPEVLEKYAPRYGFTAEELQGDPRISRIVQDKLNSDIYINQLQQQEQLDEALEPQPEPTQQPQVSREQYFQNLDRMVQERTDPEVAKQFHNDFLKAFGVTDAEIAKMPPQQAMQFTQTASKYMLNLVNTFMGDMLQAQLGQQIAQQFPGFGDMYERSSYAMAWDQVRNSNPQFQDLPAYGSKEFSHTLREAAAKIPGFDDMQFTGRDGRALPPQENAARKYAMLAQMATGQQPDPALLQRAAAAGARNASRAATRRSAGNLGSGKSNAASPSTGSSKFQSNQDIFDDETMAQLNTRL